eukprot:Phypoly_transcript_21895.p1 GENE.Phypoly_transcript_21895~~Phypoly_transcript_21895.p1  ORF type:complete len:147 (+),score=37.34 Phypoly_transcript_21895:132-572(+)
MATNNNEKEKEKVEEPQKEETTPEGSANDKSKYGNVEQLTHVMFENIANYLKGELTATTNDYKLLASMNAVASSKYSEMSEVARGLTSFMKDLQQKYQDFQPYLDKIEEIDTSVTELEKTVVLLDEYSKRLEWKFKNLDKALLPPQ